MNTFTTFHGVAFTGGKRTKHAIAVDGAGNVRVWDPTAGFYTTCHALTEAQCARLRTKARAAALSTFHGVRQFGGGPQWAGWRQ